MPMMLQPLKFVPAAYLGLELLFEVIKLEGHSPKDAIMPRDMFLLQEVFNPNCTLDLTPAFETGLTKNKVANDLHIVGGTSRSVMTIAFQFGFESHIQLQVGTLIYACIVNANTGMNPKLLCMDASEKAAKFGLFKDGYMFESSTGLSRMLLSSPTCPILEGIGKKLAFEIAINAEHSLSTILVANAIMNSETLTPVQQMIMVERLLDRALPVFTFANQAGLYMLVKTLVALQDITLEKIDDDYGKKNLCIEFPQTMQQVGTPF
ncbi:hypothetical protein T459_23687, partial [Capsicum annuum]